MENYTERIANPSLRKKAPFCGVGDKQVGLTCSLRNLRDSLSPLADQTQQKSNPFFLSWVGKIKEKGCRPKRKEWLEVRKKRGVEKSFVHAKEEDPPGGSKLCSPE